MIQSIDWSRNPSAEAARQQQYVRLWSLAIGTAPHAHDITVPLDNRSIVGSCASLKRVECLGDTSLAARFHARWDAQPGYHTWSVLCVPIVHPRYPDVILGCMQCLNKLGQHQRVVAFDEQAPDQDVAQALAASLATAVLRANELSQRGGEVEPNPRGERRLLAWDARAQRGCPIPSE